MTDDDGQRQHACDFFWGGHILEFGGDHLKVSIPSRRWSPAVKKHGAKHRVETFRFLVSEFEILP